MSRPETLCREGEWRELRQYLNGSWRMEGLHERQKALGVWEGGRKLRRQEVEEAGGW